MRFLTAGLLSAVLTGPWAFPAAAADFISDPVSLEHYTPAGQRLFDLTRRRTLLTPSERQELDDLTALLPELGETSGHLESLSLSMGEKVLADVSALDTILTSAREISRRHLGVPLPAVDSRGWREARDAWDETDDARRECMAMFKGRAPRDRQERAMRILQCQSDILTGNGPGTVGHAWELTQRVLEPVYMRWNDYREELAQKVRAGEEDGQVVAGILNFDEMTFMDLFGDLQALARRISDPASPEF